MPLDLRPEEIRVLGVLIEKSLSQPQYYPMTLNAIVQASNQKTNRHPVTDYDESTVSAAVASLRRRQLADQAAPGPNERSYKFKHLVEARFDWNAAQRALIAELLLRGPQTLGELRGRAARMTHLGSTDYARELLSELEAVDPPIVVELEREPGRSARRFAHLLGTEPTVPETTDPAAGPSEVPPPRPPAPAASTSLADLEARVARLEAQVRDLLSERP